MMKEQKRVLINKDFVAIVYEYDKIISTLLRHYPNKIISYKQARGDLGRDLRLPKSYTTKIIDKMIRQGLLIRNNKRELVIV